MIDVVTRFIPDFMTEEKYRTDRKAVWETFKASTTPLTALECHTRHGRDMQVSTTRARITELVDDGYLYRLPAKRECKEAEHNKDVTVYGTTFTGILRGLDNQ
ncbi:MAG: hypothetical protein ACI8Z7_000204 [Candidatus Nanohaloarchaea archaeon]|jgi:hypothetical protein